MNKKFLAAVIAVSLAASLTACSAEKKTETTAVETEAETTGNASLSNPWVKTDIDGVKSFLGVGFTALESFEDVTCYVAESIGVAEMNFTAPDYPEVTFTVRAQKTDALEDISGLYITWDETKDVTFGDADRYEGLVETGKDGETQVVCSMVYDKTEGLTYAVTAMGNEITEENVVELLQLVTGSME